MSEPFENLIVVSVCRRKNDTMNIYPIAYVLQSAAGAKAVIGIWSIVLADICSEVEGSNKITFPCELPASH